MQKTKIIQNFVSKSQFVLPFSRKIYQKLYLNYEICFLIRLTRARLMFVFCLFSARKPKVIYFITTKFTKNWNKFLLKPAKRNRQGRPSSQCHRAMALVVFCPAPKVRAYFGCPVTKNLDSPKWYFGLVPRFNIFYIWKKTVLYELHSYHLLEEENL